MTTIPLALDRPGVAIEQGDHICAFYRGRDQRDDVLLPFLRDGLVQGHKCIAVMDDPDVGAGDRTRSRSSSTSRAGWSPGSSS